MNFYLEATEKEVNFYKHFKIKPIATISDCSFHNLSKFGIDLGDDVCEKIDDEQDITDGCGDCPKQVENIEWYPPIDATVLLLLVIVCGTEGLKCSLYYCSELIDNILNYAIIMSLNEETYAKIQEILQNHVEEFNKL